MNEYLTDAECDKFNKLISFQIQFVTISIMFRIGVTFVLFLYVVSGVISL